MSKPVLVYGSRKLGTMLFYDSLKHPDFRIAAFVQDAAYLNADGQYLGLPQVDFAVVQEQYPPAEFDMITMIAGFNAMRERMEMFRKAKAAGYRLRNYISPSCDAAPDIQVGENNLILAQSHLGVSGKMGSNNIIRQQVYIGHDFTMGDYNVITPGCKIGGECVIANHCYIGLGAVIRDKTNIAEETLVGAGSVIIRNTEAYSKNVGNPSRVIGYHKDAGIQMRFSHE